MYFKSQNAFLLKKKPQNLFLILPFFAKFQKRFSVYLFNKKADLGDSLFIGLLLLLK